MGNQEVLSATELDALRAGDEATVIELCRAEHEKVLLQHPEYAELIEDIDPFVCRRTDLVNVLRNSPNSPVRQYLYSIFVFRQNICLASGRSFA